MHIFKIIVWIYGVLLLAGGIVGYIKAKSRMSLIMGILSGILIFLGAYLLGVSLKIGMIMIAFVSGTLAVVFYKRYTQTKTFMPGGLLLLLSLGVLVLCIAQQLAFRWGE